MRRKKTHEEYTLEVRNINSNIEVISLYNGDSAPILHKCKIDGYEWYPRPTNILRGSGCPMCAKVKKPTTEEFIARMESINSNIEVIGNYINNNTGILCRCKIDSYVWSPTPSNLLGGKGCPVCGGVKKRTIDEYVSEVARINSDIEIIGQYINAATPILHKCKLDGHEWFAQPNHILSGHGCPVCNNSIGEKLIAKYFTDHNISFMPQYTFDDCKNKKKLPFDFYLPEHKVCIEYDGLQHFQPVDHFGGEDGFVIRQHNDAIKTTYCNENNITLLRIRYDQDVGVELNNFFNNTKLMKEVV